MTKITEYFYIFSKLTTSLVLFLIIIVMGYAFFKSYQGIDDNNVNLENKISSLSSDVMLNYNNFEKDLVHVTTEKKIAMVEVKNPKVGFTLIDYIGFSLLTFVIVVGIIG